MSRYLVTSWSDPLKQRIIWAYTEHEARAEAAVFWGVSISETNAEKL